VTSVYQTTHHCLSQSAAACSIKEYAEENRTEFNCMKQ